MSEPIFCGIGKCPKGKKVGTMKECAEANQVRLYGINKIDSRVLEASKTTKKTKLSRLQLLKKYAGLNGTIKKLEGDVKYSKKQEAKDEAKKLLVEARKERTKVVRDLKKFVDDQREEEQKPVSEEAPKKKATDDLNKLTVPQLKDIIKKYEFVKAMKGMKKAELIDHVNHLKEHGKLKKKNKHLEGAGGLFDFFKPIKQGLLDSPKKTLKTYGSSNILSLKVIRTPIMSVLNKVLNVVSFGKWKQQLKKARYEDLFHLGLILTLQTSKGQKMIIMEKNSTINISPSVSIKPNSEVVDVPYSGGLTLQQFWDNISKTYPPKQLYLYSGLSSNCQDALIMFLTANKLITPALTAFIKQPMEEIAKKLGSHVKPIMKTVTDLGARFDRVVSGGTNTIKKKLKPLKE